MCIRDRARRRRADGFIDRRQRKAYRRDDEKRQAVPERACPCLLYTSDAADERSSVDLGGRRIIKKKNSREIGSTS